MSIAYTEVKPLCGEKKKKKRIFREYLYSLEVFNLEIFKFQILYLHPCTHEELSEQTCSHWKILTDRKCMVRLEMNEKGRKLIRKEKTSGIVGKTTFKFDLWEITQKKNTQLVDI